jgi:hypothetical protein
MHGLYEKFEDTKVVIRRSKSTRQCSDQNRRQENTVTKALVAKGQFLFIRPFTVLLDSRNNMGYQITRIEEYQLCMYL